MNPVHGAHSSLLIVYVTACLLAWAPLTHAAEVRKNSLDFEDSIVEGMNKKPLDSLSQINEKDSKKKRSHLYTKKTSLEIEALESASEIGLKP
jgi:hypothetical protein